MRIRIDLKVADAHQTKAVLDYAAAYVLVKHMHRGANDYIDDREPLVYCGKEVGELHVDNYENNE